jgi:hypothetical protein
MKMCRREHFAKSALCPRSKTYAGDVEPRTWGRYCPGIAIGRPAARAAVFEIFRLMSLNRKYIQTNYPKVNNNVRCITYSAGAGRAAVISSRELRAWRVGISLVWTKEVNIWPPAEFVLLTRWR